MERALEGTRVLLTRPRERSEDLAFLLEDEGAEVVSLPLLELLPPDDPRPLRSAAEGVHRYRWVLFASPSGVQAFAEAVRLAGTQRYLDRLRVGAVGVRTAQVASEYGLRVEVTADVPTGVGLAAALTGKIAAGDEVLLPAAQEGRRELELALVELGASVSRVAAYRSAAAAVDEPTRAEVLRNPPHVVVFGSPRTVHAFLEAFDAEARGVLARMKTVAIGPTTRAALETEDVAVHAIARTPTPEGLVEAVISAASDASA